MTQRKGTESHHLDILTPHLSDVIINAEGVCVCVSEYAMWILNRVVRECLPEIIFERRLKGGGGTSRADT